MPHGVLHRGGAEKSIRQCLIEQDLLEAVIGLPPNLFYSTAIPACLLIFRSAKPAQRHGTVLFVDGSRRFGKGSRSQNQMSDADIEKILAAYIGDSSADVPSRLVGHAEIKDSSWDLNIGRYLKTSSLQTITVQEAHGELIQAQAALRDAENRLDIRLKAAGLA
jgi:type I restriction enzyme M protein